MNDLNIFGTKRSPIRSILHLIPYRLSSVWMIIATFTMMTIGTSCLLMLPHASHANELVEILERGYLIVGVKDNTRPLGFRDPSGELVGFEIDLARQLALALFGNTAAVQLQPLSNQERLARLVANDVDIVIARVSVTTPRARLVDFSVPYYLDGTAFVTRNSRILNLQDLHGKTVVLLKGSSTIDVVRSHLPTVQLIGVDSYQAALNLMETGQVDAFAADVSVLSGWVQTNPHYHILPSLISADALAIAMPRGLQYLELRQRVNELLDEWTTTGWLEERIRYWRLP